MKIYFISKNIFSQLVRVSQLWPSLNIIKLIIWSVTHVTNAVHALSVETQLFKCPLVWWIVGIYWRNRRRSAAIAVGLSSYGRRLRLIRGEQHWRVSAAPNISAVAHISGHRIRLNGFRVNESWIRVFKKEIGWWTRLGNTATSGLSRCRVWW